jgi:hypothetical protein
VFVAGDNCNVTVREPQMLSTDGQDRLDTLLKGGSAGRHRRSEVLHSREIAIPLVRIAPLVPVQRIIHSR